MSTSSSIDVGIVIALREEFIELHDQIADKCESVRDSATGNYYYLFDYQCANRETCYRCVATFAGSMGPTKAGLITQRLVNEYKPNTLVMLGIAAGLSGDVKLGDVVVATVVDAYMENSKAEGQDEFSFALSGEVYRPSGDLVNFAQNFQFAHRDAFQQWLRKCSNELLGLFPNEEYLDNLIKEGLIRDKAHLIAGHIASGPTVGAAEAFNNWLKRRNRKYLALEMEAAGLMAAVYEEATPRRTLVLRAVSDYGDQRKGELDGVNSGAFRLYAIRNAIALLWEFLNTHALPNPSPIAQRTALSHSEAVAPSVSTLPSLIGASANSQELTAAPVDQINALSRVIGGEDINLEAVSNIRQGSDAVNPARELSTRFLSLPLYKRIRLGQALGLLLEEEKTLQADEVARRIFTRAKEERKLDQLWDEVEEARGGLAKADRSQNPFSSK